MIRNYIYYNVRILGFMNEIEVGLYVLCIIGIWYKDIIIKDKICMIYVVVIKWMYVFIVIIV